MRLPLTPSWRWFLGGVLLSAWFFGIILTPIAPAYFQIVPPSAHIGLFFVGMAGLIAVSRCTKCGWPVGLQKLKGGGYLIGGAGKTCSNCDAPI